MTGYVSGTGAGVRRVEVLDPCPGSVSVLVKETDSERDVA